MSLILLVRTQDLLCIFGSPNEIFHVAVMPCFDKKLEASRNDFYNEVSQSKDVDCVLTTGLYVRI